jgi:enamine deaminase RidA (YjgF/YER057c/UK114 family)
MRNLLDNLEEAGLNFEQVVSTTVYLDDLSDSQSFDPVYGQYFTLMPSRTTVQQIAPAERHADKDDHYPDLEQISLIAIRSQAK